jgi:hypothetical protein
MAAFGAINNRVGFKPLDFGPRHPHPVIMAVIKNVKRFIVLIELDAYPLPVSFVKLKVHAIREAKLVVGIEEPVGDVLSGNVFEKNRSAGVDRTIGDMRNAVPGPFLIKRDLQVQFYIL